MALSSVGETIVKISYYILTNFHRLISFFWKILQLTSICLSIRPKTIAQDTEANILQNKDKGSYHLNNKTECSGHQQGRKINKSLRQAWDNLWLCWPIWEQLNKTILIRYCCWAEIHIWLFSIAFINFFFLPSSRKYETELLESEKWH